MSEKRARHQAKRARRRAQPDLLPGYASCQTCGQVGVALNMVELYSGGRSRYWCATKACTPDPSWPAQQLQLWPER
jgi:hypothetical protein